MPALYGTTLIIEHRPETPLVSQGFERFVQLFFQLNPPFLQLLTAGHLSLLELMGRLVEILALFLPAALLLLIPLLCVAIHVRALLIGPILLIGLIQLSELLLQFSALFLLAPVQCLPFLFVSLLECTIGFVYFLLEA